MKRVNASKVSAIMVATMLLGTVSPISVLAADKGWVQKGNDWYYQDAKGNNVTEAWRDNDSKTHKFYLGEDGRMVRSELFDIDDKWYYVNGDGIQSVNMWRLLNSDYDDCERWFYFDNNGRAYDSGWKTINGKRYHFTDHTMDYGFLTESGEMIEDTEDAWKEAVYYVGDNNVGWRFENQWVLVDNYDTSEYDQKELWLYFGANGKKVTNKIQTIKNVRYAFDENGAMVYEWHGTATPSDAAYKYYNQETGEQQNNGWFKAVPSEEQDAEAHDEGEERLFYAGKSGVTYKDGIKTIGGKKYIFDKFGIMRTGLILINQNKQIVEVIEEDPYDFPSAESLRGLRSKGDLIMTDKNGVIKTGKFTVELDGEKTTLNFNKNGVAKHGVDNNYLYDNGVLIKVDKDESEFKYMSYTLDGKTYCVDTAGRVKKAGTYADGDYKWVVTDAGEKGYTVTRTTK